MADAEYRQKLNAFKNSCRTYAKEKENIKKLLKEYPSLKNIVTESEEGVLTVTEIVTQKESDKIPMKFVRLYQYMLEDVWFVEHGMQKIQNAFGDEAEQIVKEVLIDGVTQEAVAADHDLSRWQLQNSSIKWLQAALEDGNDGH